jgi:hypothetical protein
MSVPRNAQNNGQNTTHGTDYTSRLLDHPPGPGAGRTATLLALPLLVTAVAAVAAGVRLLGSANTRLAPATFVIGAFLFIASGVLPVLVLRESSLELLPAARGVAHP